MEVTQFTYFQQCGGLDLPRVSCELTYGLERLAMYLQEKESVYDLVWAKLPTGQEISYGDVHLQDEREWSAYNFEHADVEMCFDSFKQCQAEAESLLEKGGWFCRPTITHSNALTSSTFLMRAAPSP